MSYRGIRHQASPTEQIAAFSELMAPMGVQVHHAASISEASYRLRELAAELAVSRVLVSSELLETFPALGGALAERGLELIIAGDPAMSLDAPLGVTTARNAIAETGSLLMSEATLADRSVGLLSLVLAVVLPSSVMLPNLDDASRVLRAEARKLGGAYSTLVTGPSRTADIELSLTVGVQGPGRVVVIFVEGNSD